MLLLAAAIATANLSATWAATGAAERGAQLAPATLGEHIDAIVNDPFFASAAIGVHAVDLENGQPIYARDAGVIRNPASNVKLFTTAAALLILGPEHRYVTKLLRNKGAQSGGVITGNVYLQGSGDPLLVTEDLLKLAFELRASGVRKISGGIVVDASAFDRDELPPGFDQKPEVAAYRAPSGAVSVNFNTFVVRVTPAAAAGAPAVVGLQPNVRGIRIRSTASTVAGWRRQLFAELTPTQAGLDVELRGKIGVEATTGIFRYPIAGPARYAGAVMVFACSKAGIKLGRKAVRLGRAPAEAVGLAAHFSPALSILLRSVNKFSNNFMAEQILKTLAPSPASFSAATARELEVLRDYGVALDGARITNGSGLYDTNRVAPAHVTSLLAAVYADFRYRADFLASLSVMGVDGTSRLRLDETFADRWIRVKTGTLDGISALSGYVGAKGRAPVVFSILFNDLPKGGTTRARQAQDHIAGLLAQYTTNQPFGPL